SGKMIKSFKQTFLSLDLQSPRWSSTETMVTTKAQGNRALWSEYCKTAKWVSTVIRGETQKEALRQGFWKLFHYIQGKNEKEMKIDMTVPMTCLIKSGCADFKVSFFVPFEHQDSPPQPTDSDVFIEERKAAAIFVRSFGGFASPEKYAEEAEVLARILRNRGQPFHEDFFYTAGYDSPFKLFNRHNECNPLFCNLPPIKTEEPL
uniref:Heme binding protein 2 n=1 Tax=Strigops habroptila TaxID=2489341 RepID=A0A672UU17_STRHB